MRRCGHPRKLCSAEERKILRIIKKNLATIYIKNFIRDQRI